MEAPPEILTLTHCGVSITSTFVAASSATNEALTIYLLPNQRSAKLAHPISRCTADPRSTNGREEHRALLWGLARE